MVQNITGIQNMTNDDTTTNQNETIGEIQEIVIPKEYIDIAQKTFEINYAERSAQHEILFAIDAYIEFTPDDLKSAFQKWYEQKFKLILRCFNESQGTAIQIEQIQPQIFEQLTTFEGNLIELFNEVVEELGYTLHSNLQEDVLAYNHYIRFINVILTTKKGDYVSNSRNLDLLYKSAVEKKIDISKDKIKDQYPKLYEGKSSKNFITKEALEIDVIEIASQQIKLYEGLRQIRTALFVDVYETKEQAEVETEKAFVRRLITQNKRIVTSAIHKNPPGKDTLNSYAFLRKVDGSTTNFDDLIREVIRQYIADKISTEDILKGDSKATKQLEKILEKDKDLVSFQKELYDVVVATATLLKDIGTFKGDVQRLSYVGLLKNLLCKKTGLFFKKPDSVDITQLAETKRFLDALGKQLAIVKDISEEIQTAVYKANQLRRTIDSYAANETLNQYLLKVKKELTPLDDAFGLKIFTAMSLPKEKISLELDNIKNELVDTMKEVKLKQG